MSKQIVWHKKPATYTMLGVQGGNWLYKPRSNSRWFISYQDFSGGGRDEFMEVLNTVFTGDSRRDDETALYDGRVWRILWGDHRRAYEKAIPNGLEGCIKTYEKLKPKHGCKKWSTDE